MHTHKRWLLLALLGLLLVAVIAAGVWLLARSGERNAAEEITQPENTQTEKLENAGQEASQETAQETGPGALAYQARRYHISSSQQEGQTTRRMFLYDGKLCQFTEDFETTVEPPPVELAEEDPLKYNEMFMASEASKELRTVQVTSVMDGTVLKTFERDAFPAFFSDFSAAQLFLDAEGQLWGMIEERDGSVSVGRCVPEQTKKDWIRIQIEDMQAAASKNKIRGMNSFGVYGNSVLLLVRTDHLYGNRAVIIYRQEDGACYAVEDILEYAVGDDGMLYCLRNPQERRFMLEQRILDSGEVQWTQTELPIRTRTLSAPCGGQLYLIGNWPEADILTVDQQTGEFGSWTLPLPAELRTALAGRSYNLSLGADGQGHIAMCTSRSGYKDGRETWIMEEYLTDIHENEIVSLTITAPYPVDSIVRAVHQYQQEHPEVQVTWDTPYFSREEYIKNGMNYREQITLQTMAGDTGDLQMILGAGIAQEVVTDTDAFTDLAPYLEQYDYKEELEWNLVETLRGQDGAVRAAPLGIRPSYYFYNKTLAASEHVALSPVRATWSEVLKLALQWKKDGKDLSLISAYPSEQTSVRESLLTDLLLANLYGFEQEDGTLRMDRPEFLDLLRDLKELWDSPQLVRGDGDRFEDGFFQKALFATMPPNVSSYERYMWVDMLQERENIQIDVVPRPWGETYQKQQGYASCWGIPSASQKKDAAWDLLAYILSSEGLPGYAYSSDTETLNSKTQDAYFDMNLNVFIGAGDKDTVKRAYQQFKSLRQYPFSRFDEIYGWSDAVQVPIEDYLNGKRTLDEAIETASDNWSRLMMG